MIHPEPNRTSEPWRVGVLFSRSGCLSLIEETQFRGTMVAIEEINDAGGIHGREVQPFIYDPASDDALFRAYAFRLLTEDRVQSIFGCYASSSRKAVLPIVERLNGLLWYPTLYEGFEYSPSIIYTGASPNQNSLALISHMTRNHGQRSYFVGSDYIYPRETNRIMRQLLTNQGGTVAGETYLPINARPHDFATVMRDIRAAQPDFIFSTIVGEATVYLYQAFSDANFDARRMPIASLTTTEAEIRAMGRDVAEGHFTAGSYFQGAGGPMEFGFVSRYVRRFGDEDSINLCAEAAYFQVHLFAHALALANSIDTDLLRPVVLGSSVDAPQGRVSMSPASSHANVWSRIGRANARGRFDIVHQSAAQVDADPFLIAAFHGS